MRRKYGRLLKKDNVIVFPGAYEKLVEDGRQAVELEQFEKAVEAFDQAIRYNPESVEFLGPYAIALYETKDFSRAKEFAARLLYSGTADYIAAMELYLAISIQLQHYDEVRETIETLFEEQIIPEQMIKKFNYLRELNERLSERYGNQEGNSAAERFSFEEFMTIGTDMQQAMLASLENSELDAMLPVLTRIIRSDDVSPVVKTFSLILLKQAKYEKEVGIRKFGMEMKVIPAQLPLPNEDELTGDVLQLAEQTLEKDPSKLEMVKSIIRKYGIVSYPFSWGNYTPDEVMDAYKIYIESLMTGQQLPDDELIDFIRYVDMDLDR
ncbi:tetratricopeptide (TPR) repeat protein [Sporosarcina luteola]|nr:tetratricopeptide (TPR) repeat protein [Sporosarcina luteola]